MPSGQPQIFVVVEDAALADEMCVLNECVLSMPRCWSLLTRQESQVADFRVEVVRLQIEAHPNADALELARIGDYLAVVKKGQYSTGDLAAYIPEQAIVPQWLLHEMGLTGRLAGAEKNRVKAIRLRGVLSQGLVYGPRPDWRLGDDVTDELAITKHRPKVPTYMSGEVWAAGPDRCMRYDINAHRRYPDVLEVGEQVVFTEKIHGTWTQFAALPPDLMEPEQGALVVTSKGLGAKGLAFQMTEKARRDNLYVRAAISLGIEARIRGAFPILAREPVFVLGELFGQGVQDLDYGADAQREDLPGFRIFDVYIGRPGHGRFLEDAELALTDNDARQRLLDSMKDACLGLL